MRPLWRNVRRSFDGTGGVTGVGIALFVIGLLIFASFILSGDAWQLWGTKTVPGREVGGVVLYQYQGRNYSIDDLGSYHTGSKTVYLEPSDPSKATVHPEVTQLTVSLISGIPCVFGVGLIVTGFTRRARNRSRRKSVVVAKPEESFGTGLDPDLVSRLLAERKSPPQPDSARNLSPFQRPSGFPEKSPERNE